MAEFPAMPLWTDAYLADTRHLNTLEHGAYLLLLMESWRRSRCSLPDDDDMLARLAGLQLDEWAEIRPVVMGFWTLDRRSKEWTQTRQKKERCFVEVRSRLQSDRAKSGWNKRKNFDAAAMPDRCRIDAPTPTPTPKVKRDSNESLKKGSRLPESWSLPQPWGTWAMQQGLDDQQVRYQADQFRDYWISVPGQRGVKLNWKATWRNWIRSSIARGAFSNGGPSSRPEPMTASDHIMADLKRRAGK